MDAELCAHDDSGELWLTLYAGYAGDPSLRLKNGFARDDKSFEYDQWPGCGFPRDSFC
jgi:hypothetical protein